MNMLVTSKNVAYIGVRKLFGWLEAATFKVLLEDGRAVHMRAALPHGDDCYAVVMVDSDRFLELWRQPLSSHREVALNTPATWPNDYKYAHAVDGFSHGFENPVPLAEVSCWRSTGDVVEYRTYFHFFQRKVVIGRAGEPCLSFVNGITRTIYLLANGVRSFPVLCERQAADLLVELAGWKGTHPLQLSLFRKV
ncbi:hypothetical protein [Massilia sp. CCM 8734]|uniref:plasmid fertility inhibition factor family protein n=1 Tax=Massilia sp. CCM 8734 TaxID=2609283 RepID=UPI00141DAC76|nr:hypothetical protein [Massilia sp. CCM 8734]NHZ99111.1 hypothetical protein [Massilia sp. CCM 8734]